LILHQFQYHFHHQELLCLVYPKKKKIFFNHSFSRLTGDIDDTLEQGLSKIDDDILSPLVSNDKKVK